MAEEWCKYTKPTQMINLNEQDYVVHNSRLYKIKSLQHKMSGRGRSVHIRLTLYDPLVDQTICIQKLSSSIIPQISKRIIETREYTLLGLLNISDLSIGGLNKYCDSTCQEVDDSTGAKILDAHVRRLGRGS